MDDISKSFSGQPDHAREQTDDFLLSEGFDLIAAFRAIKSEQAREAIIKLVAAVVQAENDASRSPDE